MHDIVFIPEASRDYTGLDGSVRKDVDRKLEALQQNPLLGDPLGHKFNIDLTGFYKLYAHGRQFRMVYRILDQSEVEIIEIWGIGKREKEEIYRKVSRRLGAMLNKPEDV